LEIEVIFPPLYPRVEEWYHLSCIRVDPRQVGPFVEVAVLAGQGQIGEIVGATVLPGNDVLDLEAKERVSLL
jgi:hypothetical protein